MIRLTLTPEQWKTLKAWATEEDVSLAALVARLVREEVLHPDP